jgi:sulfate transport system permease protein
MAAESVYVRVALIAVATCLLTLLVLMPLAQIVIAAAANGWLAYFAALVDAETLSAIRLTIVVTAIALPINTVFGMVAAWCIAKFEFRGKQFLTSIIDLPMSVSPVIAGLIFVLLFGAQGWLGPFLRAHGVTIVFALPALVLVTVFVTIPFVARQLIPLMQHQGRDEEEAAVGLGAGGLQTFWRVTLPGIRWALFYGVLLCNARAMGEFGGVAVVSGHIRGATVTMPLQVEILYNDYNSVGAFAVASLLAMLALVTLVARRIVEWRNRDDLVAARMV